jgi:2-keto-3-deoxy-L-rhamnonate aldolase RhmA
MNTNTEFRIRLRRGDPMCGPFIKTPHYQNIEIAGAAGMDFVVLDAEHAPFSIEAIDRCLLGCAGASLPGLVRLPDAEPSTILQVLDMGAAGIVVPHIVSATQARAAVAATRYRDGVRGFSNSPRAGGYGRLAMAEHLRSHDAAVSVVCQIEDPEAVDHVDEIAAVSGVDCLFIGRADLAVSSRQIRSMTSVLNAPSRRDGPQASPSVCFCLMRARRGATPIAACAFSSSVLTSRY